MSVRIAGVTIRSDRLIVSAVLVPLQCPPSNPIRNSLRLSLSTRS
jgi:hypothetical protein